MNTGSDGTNSDLYTTNFYGINSPSLNTNNSPNSRFNFYTNIVNMGAGGSLTNRNLSNSNTTKCERKKKVGGGGSGLNINFRSAWDWFKGIFKSRGRVMSGGCLTSDISIDGTGNVGSMATIDKDVLYDFRIPLDKSDFTFQPLKKRTTENFDCACEKDKPLGIAKFLELAPEQTMFILDFEQKELREEICACVKKNNYSQEIKTRIKRDLEKLINGNPLSNTSCIKDKCPEGYIKSGTQCVCAEGYVKDSNNRCVKKPCVGDPVKNPKIVSSGKSGKKGGTFGCTRSNWKRLCFRIMWNH